MLLIHNTKCERTLRGMRVPVRLLIRLPQNSSINSIPTIDKPQRSLSKYFYGLYQVSHCLFCTIVPADNMPTRNNTILQ